MIHNIALIGYGRWGKVIENFLNQSSEYNLVSIVTSQKFHKKNKIKFYKRINDLTKNEKIDCLYIAKDPFANFTTLEHCKKLGLPIIFEKPISNNSINLSKIINIIKKNKIIAFTNLPNIFSDTHKITKKYFIENKLKIKKIILHEGSNDYPREKIHPILDWAIHPISYILSIIDNSEIDRINYNQIIYKKVENKYVSKFNITLSNKINIKIVTGNSFKKKLRILKIILNNGDVFINNFERHEVYINNEKIFTSEKKPLNNLFNKFSKSIENDDRKEGLNSIMLSFQSIKIIEKYLLK
tara:strand:- start:5026 stop:5919 length:894 start_codon:yes stop_codon:yes gene_type:complete